MAAKYPEEAKKKAKELVEEQGFTVAAVARKLGIPSSTVHGWSVEGGWVLPEVTRRVRVEETRVTVDPVLDSLVKRMEGLTKTEREKEYDEALHLFATSVPMILKQLPANEVIAKADKVAKLVEMSRNVLGRNDKQAGRPMLNLGVLLSSAAPEKQARISEVVDVEKDGE